MAYDNMCHVDSLKLAKCHLLFEGRLPVSPHDEFAPKSKHVYFSFFNPSKVTDEV